MLVTTRCRQWDGERIGGEGLGSGWGGRVGGDVEEKPAEEKIQNLKTGEEFERKVAEEGKIGGGRESKDRVEEERREDRR